MYRSRTLPDNCYKTKQQCMEDRTTNRLSENKISTTPKVKMKHTFSAEDVGRLKENKRTKGFYDNSVQHGEVKNISVEEYLEQHPV